MDTEQPKNKINSFVHLYSWSAPERYWTKREKSWYLWYSLLFVVLIFLSALTEQYFLILALIALLLLLFAQAAIPPTILKHEITNRGIKVFDSFFKWQDIDHFWITEKVDGGIFARLNKRHDKYKLVNFDLPKKNPPRISLLINSADEEMVVSTLLEYIPYADAEETSDDFLSRLIYGSHVPFKHYAPETEYYPEDEDFPEQELSDKEDARQEQSSQLKSLSANKIADDADEKAE
jgi:hypothetical protein